MIDGAEIGIIMIISFILSAFMSFLVPVISAFKVLSIKNRPFLTRVMRTDWWSSVH